MNDFLCRDQREDLAILPTPVHKLERFSKEVGAEVWFKRDDLTHYLASGNKIRKLEYLFHKAKSSGARAVVTCGGIQSNHARATAAICRMIGMKPVLFLRGSQPDLPQGNFLLDFLLGAEIHWMTPEDYRRRDGIMEQYRMNQPIPHEVFVIPEGGSDPTGVNGYASALLEMAEQLDLEEMDGIFVPVGSGGTYSGLIAGAALLKISTPIYGINVTLDSNPYFPDKCEAMVRSWMKENQVERKVDPSAFHIVDSFVGDGYAVPTPSGLRWIVDLMKLEGILLDPVYTSKAIDGMVHTLRQEGMKKVLFIHTGGGFGNFAFADSLSGQLAPLL